MKTVRWHGEEISYDDRNLVPLLSRVSHLAGHNNVTFFIELIEKGFSGEELLYGDWLKIKERLNIYL